MTLTLTAIDHETVCHGWKWEIQNEETLAYQVAQIAVGNYRHVARILKSFPTVIPQPSTDQISASVELLLLKPGQDPWHRDGWIFQAISWIAAHQHSKLAAIRAPHLIKAHKGFDGLEIELSGDGQSVVGVIIYEDKATDNARSTIRDDVWPEIRDIEAGKRSNELMQETTALLEAQQKTFPLADIDAALSTLLWKEARRFRVCITVGNSHNSTARRKRLFKDFDIEVSGDVLRRRAETLYLPDVRKWMDNFSTKILAAISSLAPNV